MYILDKEAHGHFEMFMKDSRANAGHKCKASLENGTATKVYLNDNIYRIIYK